MLLELKYSYVLAMFPMVVVGILPNINYDHLWIGLLGWGFGSLIKGKTESELPAWREHLAGFLLSIFVIIYGMAFISVRTTDTVFAGSEVMILFFLNASGTPWAKTIIEIIPSMVSLLVKRGVEK